MTRWQPKEALWRALKTFLQTFAGALTGVTIVSGADAQRALATAAFSAGVAAIMAFAMNLEATNPSVEL